MISNFKTRFEEGTNLTATEEPGPELLALGQVFLCAAVSKSLVVSGRARVYTAEFDRLTGTIRRKMASRELERIRRAVLQQQYTLTEHAYDEMDEDLLDALDVEAAILTGQIKQKLIKDPRGTRYVITGKAIDETTPVSVVVRFVEDDRLLVLTVYEKK